MKAQGAIVVAVIERLAIEHVLWSACARSCAIVGEATVFRIAGLVVGIAAGEVDLASSDQRKAALHLIDAAGFVKALAGMHAAIVLKEARLPSAGELASRTREEGWDRVDGALELAVAFLAQAIET